MELIFDDVKPRNKKIVVGGEMGKLKEDMLKMLRKHKIQNSEEHIDKLQGSGFFDSLVKIGKKAVEVGKTAYDVYKKNEKTINKAIDIGKNAVDGYKQGGLKGSVSKMLGGKMTREQYQNRLNEIKAKHGLNHKEAMMYYKKHYGKK
jgi:hypothetical protein